jgi:hypothetical protein
MFSLGNVRGSSASACAMLCDHSGPTTAMHNMHAQQEPHAPVKPRESAPIPFLTTRPLRPGPPTTGSSLGPQGYPHRPTHVFPVHFLLTDAHLGRTSQSVTYCSRSSALNFGVSGDGVPEKKLQLIGMSILINPFMPWARMSYTHPNLRRSTS